MQKKTHADYRSTQEQSNDTIACGCILNRDVNHLMVRTFHLPVSKSLHRGSVSVCGLNIETDHIQDCLGIPGTTFSQITACNGKGQWVHTICGKHVGYNASFLEQGH